MVVYTDEGAREGKGLSVCCEDGRVDVACGWQHDGNRYEADTKDGCGGGNEKLYFDIGFTHNNKEDPPCPSLKGRELYSPLRGRKRGSLLFTI